MSQWVQLAEREKGLPSRRGTGFPPDPESPRLPCGVCGDHLQWGIRYAARPKAAWRSSQALGPAPKFEPTNHVRCACEIRAGVVPHMFNDSSENFIDGEDFVCVLHAFQFRHKRTKKRKAYM
jgi:hypothetical protein